MNRNIKTVDDFFNSATQWQEEMNLFRRILLSCGLTEELKWSSPCYTFQKTNIAIIGGFKDYCVISFLKGVLLNDGEKILTQPGENSQSVRMARFTNIQDIIKLEAILKAYVFEAIEVEKLGLKIEFNDNTNLDLSPELVSSLTNNPSLKIAFEALTPGRQRAYNMYISSSKNEKTRYARIEKYTPRILMGKGINDCICGLTKKPPQCDGSHKSLE